MLSQKPPSSACLVAGIGMRIGACVACGFREVVYGFVGIVRRGFVVADRNMSFGMNTNIMLYEVQTLSASEGVSGANLL